MGCFARYFVTAMRKCYNVLYEQIDPQVRMGVHKLRRVENRLLSFSHFHCMWRIASLNVLGWEHLQKLYLVLRKVTLGQVSCMPIITSTWEAGIGKTEVQGQPGQKVSETTSQDMSQIWWWVPMIPAVREAVGRRIKVRGWKKHKTWN